MRERGVIKSVKTNKGIIQGDVYVLAMGAQSTDLAKTLGIKLPIYPMKGYSITVPATTNCPDVSVTDTETKTVYCRLGNRLRIAGFAEFSGTDKKIKRSRIDQMLKNAKSFLADAGDYDHVIDSWCGLRPVTPDSLPIVSCCDIGNLFLNTGHGMLGWTYSAATADVITDIILGNIPSLDVSSLSLSRF